MPKAYLHLRDGTDVSLDPEGIEYADTAALHRAVVVNVRSIMSEDLKSGGLIDFRPRIDAEDEAGNLLYSLPFRDAVHIIES